MPNEAKKRMEYEQSDRKKIRYSLKNLQYMLNSLDTDSLEQQINENQIAKFNDSDPNDRFYSIPPLLHEKILKIIHNPEIQRYTTVDDFMNDSIELFTTWWSAPEKTTEMMINMWKDMTPSMKNEIKKNAPEFYQQMEGAVKQMDNAAQQMNDVAHQSMKKELERIPGDKFSTSEDEFVTSSDDFGGAGKKGFLAPWFNATEKNVDEIKKKCKSFLIEQDGLILNDDYPLIWSFYTRFFPAKLALLTLLTMIYDQSNSMEQVPETFSQEYMNGWKPVFIEYSRFQEKAYQNVVLMSDYIRTLEKRNNVPRHLKFSTGLPSPHGKYESGDPEQVFVERKKVESSKKRFTSQYLGREQKDGTFSGLLNAAGFVQIIRKDDPKDLRDQPLFISLTKKGLEFIQKENSLINRTPDIQYLDLMSTIPTLMESNSSESENNVTPLSFGESAFILGDVIPQFELESLIIYHILNTLKEKKEIDSKSIDVQVGVALSEWCDIRQDQAGRHKISPIDSKLMLSLRIATMGRLTELGVARWTVRNGLSYYTKDTEHFDSLYKIFTENCKTHLPKNLIPLLKQKKKK